MKRTIIIATLFLVSSCTFSQAPSSSRLASTVKAPELTAAQENSILKLQRDLARVQSAIDSVNAQFSACKSLVDQYTDQSSAAFKAFQQAQTQVKTISAQLQEEYKKVAVKGFTFDQNALKYTPEAGTEVPLSQLVPPGQAPNQPKENKK